MTTLSTQPVNSAVADNFIALQPALSRGLPGSPSQIAGGTLWRYVSLLGSTADYSEPRQNLHQSQGDSCHRLRDSAVTNDSTHHKASPEGKMSRISRSNTHLERARRDSNSQP